MCAYPTCEFMCDCVHIHVYVWDAVLPILNLYKMKQAVYFSVIWFEPLHFFKKSCFICSLKFACIYTMCFELSHTPLLPSTSSWCSPLFRSQLHVFFLYIVVNRINNPGCHSLVLAIGVWVCNHLVRYE